MQEGYFQGKLQVRNPSQKALDYIEDLLCSQEKKPVSKVKAVRGGIDYYFVSNKFLKQFGKMVKDKFPCEMKLSSKLFTRHKQTGKEVFRGTVMLRFPDFKKGEVGMYKGDEVKIIRIDNKVRLKNLKTGKSKDIVFGDVQEGFRPS